MSAADERSEGKGGAGAVSAGRVGRAHGLDGSFYVTGARARLLALGTLVRVAARASTLSARVVRRAGTDERPIVRLQGVEDRGAAEALRGAELTVDLAGAPSLEPDEWWAGELEGCEVFDGERRVGTVKRLVELPSCEALEVYLAASEGGEAMQSAGDLLIPMVRDAIRHVDVVGRRIEVDMAFLEGS